MSASVDIRAQTFAAIDATGTEVADDEKKASKVLFDQLRRHREDLSGSAVLPPADPELDARIRREAARRSAELRDGRAVVRASLGRLATGNSGIPAWVWVAWMLAITGVAAAFWLLW